MAKKIRFSAAHWIKCIVVDQRGVDIKMLRKKRLEKEKIEVLVLANKFSSMDERTVDKAK